MSDANYQSLTEYGLKFATMMLQKAGEFHPFGAALDHDDKVHGIGGWNGDESPDPKDMSQLLVKAIQGELKNGKFQLGLLVYNGYMQTENGKSAAIVMHIISPNGKSDKIEYPYNTKRL